VVDDAKVASGERREQHILANPRIAQDRRRALALAQIAEDSNSCSLSLDVLTPEQALERFDCAVA
jgi:hypothetical protein